MKPKPHPAPPRESPLWSDPDALYAWMLIVNAAGLEDPHKWVRRTNWLAQDSNQTWYAYFKEPYINENDQSWNSPDIANWEAVGHFPNCHLDWTETLFAINKGVEP